MDCGELSFPPGFLSRPGIPDEIMITMMMMMERVMIVVALMRMMVVMNEGYDGDNEDDGVDGEDRDDNLCLLANQLARKHLADSHFHHWTKLFYFSPLHKIISLFTTGQNYVTFPFNILNLNLDKN